MYGPRALGLGSGPRAQGSRPRPPGRGLGLIKGKHTIPYPEIPNFQILVFGPFTPQIEEWRGRDLSSFFRNEKLHVFILALFQKTVIGPFFEARTGQKPKIEILVSQGRVWYVSQ